MQTDKQKTETAEDSEMGRSNKDTPAGHLRHLINIGWAVDSPLIRKYIKKNNLQGELCQIVKESTR